MIRVKRNTYLEGRIKGFPDPNEVLIRGKEEKERFGNDKRRETSSERAEILIRSTVDVCRLLLAGILPDLS